MNTATYARALGRRGGLARAARLSSLEKKQIASLGGHARLRSLRAGERIEANLRYAAAVDGLRAQPAPVKRMKAFAGPLPGIYRACVDRA